MRFFLIRKSSVVTAAVVLAALAAVLVMSGGGAVTVSAAKRQLPIYCVEKSEKLASLSFDAAWGNEDTGQLIEILEKYNVKATFFVVGDWAEKYPESVKQLHDAGHEVMNHSNKHDHMPKLSRDQIIADINSCNDKIEKVTGVRPALFRPPYGEYDDKLVTALKSLGMFTIQWDVDSLDWKDLPSGEISSRVLSRVKPGSICLFHNAAKNTPAALPSIIEGLQKDGYKLVPISELILKDSYEIDHEGRQRPIKSEA